MLTPTAGTRMEDTTVPAKPATMEPELYVRTLTNAALFLYTTAMKRPRVKILRPNSNAPATKVLFLSLQVELFVVLILSFQTESS